VRPSWLPIPLAACVAIAVAGCGSTLVNTAAAKQDSTGDPYVTWSQVHAIRKGESKHAAFKELHGVADSGYQMPQGAGAFGFATYDYPIRGTGSGDAAGVDNDSYRWLQLCTNHGQVTGTDIGKMSSLPTVTC
jgi:hypothetical protein